MQTILSLVCSCILIYAFQKALAFWKATRAIQNHPGYRLLISPTSIIFSRFLPKISGVNVGSHHVFKDKHHSFATAGWDIYTAISAFPKTKTAVYTADADVIKEVTSSRGRFQKPVSLLKLIMFYGNNIVASEGDEWKKYRKILAPAFSDRNNKLVWNASVDIVQSLFEDLWAGQDIVTVDNCVDITLPMALFVIGTAGFGRTISWKDDDVVPPGHTMTFKESLRVMATDWVSMLLVPEKAMCLTEKLRTTKRAFNELRLHMVEMIHDRQRTEKVQRHDLLSSLLEANDHDFDITTLTDEEILGNIYIILLAGHESTAHTLCFTFAMLALYPEEQEKLLKHIKSVILDGQRPTYEQMPLLTYSLAIFNETLRLFPVATSLRRCPTEDTSLVATNIHGEKCTIPIAKEVDIMISITGLHYNPRYWKDPHAFRPSRFLEDYPRDAFLPFGFGPRACLGRKFFETEGIAILTMLVSQYKITVKEEPQFAHETFEQRKARLSESSQGLSLTPLRVPLVFARRK